MTMNPLIENPKPSKHKHRWVHKRSFPCSLREYKRTVERECDICSKVSLKILPLEVPVLDTTLLDDGKTCSKENISYIHKLQDKIGYMLNEYVNAVYRIEGKYLKAETKLTFVGSRIESTVHLGSRIYTGSRMIDSPIGNRITRNYGKNT